MGAETKIEWTDHTFNPWRGCARVSPGCEHCYAEALAKRTGIHGTWGPKGERVVSSDAYWRHPLRWDRDAAAAGIRRRVFCASMADVFEDRPDLLEPRARLAYLIGRTPNLDWLLLTKRPENVVRLWCTDVVPANVWLGTTVEDQARADERIPKLLAAPAAVRFLSVEPLLGPVDLRPYLSLRSTTRWCWPCGYATNRRDEACPNCGRELTPDRHIDWVIVGGESGPGARPCDVAWILSVVRQCREAGVPVFVKQLGSRPTTTGQEDFPAGVGWHDRDQRFILRDPKGGDPSEWPGDLCVREFPTGVR